MNRALKVAKWQLRDSRKAILIFYGVVIAVLTLIVMVNLLYGSGQGKSGGLDANEVVFCFVLGLNSFTSAFKFTQANNISRRCVFRASLVSFAGIAALMAITSNILGAILRQVMPYESMMTQLYRIEAWPTQLIWSFALNAFAIFLGWMITMIYYRSNKVQKTLVSMSPAFLIFGLVYLNNRTGGRLGAALVRAIGKALGVADVLNPNPLVAAFSFLVGAACCAALSFLLIRRAPIRS